MTRKMTKSRYTALAGVSTCLLSLMMAMGPAGQVNAQETSAQSQVRVMQGERINRVVFEGNKKINKDILGGLVATQANNTYNQVTVNADIERIRDAYQRSGRSLASISPRTVQLPNGTVDVVFTINEGDKTGVKEINFVGNNVYSSYKLRNLMSTTESNFMSWIKSSDVYDPIRIASDEDTLRRYYLRNGYADFQITSTDVKFDEKRGGYIVTIAVSEGQKYRISDVSVDSRITSAQNSQLESLLRTRAGDVYDVEAVEKSLENITTEVSGAGNPFVQVRPTGMRNAETGTVSLQYVVDEGPHVYIERINVRGNSRTRDYVIRREFDIGEGDAYNKVLVDRAERRLNNLGCFKDVRITSEPGSSPDRVVVNVDVEDQSTGQFSVSGGYSTSDGFIGEVAVAESNFLGRGQFVRVAGSWGQYSQGVDFSFTEPYFLGQRMAFGFDLFSKFSDNSRYSRYEDRMTGGQLRLGLPVDEATTLTLRYSLYQSRIKVPNDWRRPYNDCLVPIPGYTKLNPDGSPAYPDCTWDGQASLAIKEATGTTVTSLVGATLTYNTLDNTRNPTSGLYAELKPDVAGIGGDSRFIRAAADARYYHELFDEVVGFARVQGGHVSALGNKDLRIVDNYFLGPSLVRGFAPSGFGPRDMSGDFQNNALGGSSYFGGTLEVQFPIFGLPREVGLKGAVFTDAGTLFGYDGQKDFSASLGVAPNCQGLPNFAPNRQPTCVNVLDNKKIRSSVGASLLWASPLGPLRFDYAFVTSKVRGDQTQAFRFSGGTSF